MLFELGKVVGTPAALSLLAESEKTPDEYLERHVSGDWGEVEREDDLANFRAVKNLERILSAYTVKEGKRIWIITEADRSVTTFLLPEEY